MNRLKRRLIHTCAVGAVVGGFVSTFTALMAGGAIGKFLAGDVWSAALLGFAAVGGRMWGWAEHRARSAYEAGVADGTRLADAHIINDVLSEAFKRLGPPPPKKESEHG